MVIWNSLQKLMTLRKKTPGLDVNGESGKSTELLVGFIRANGTNMVKEMDKVSRLTQTTCNLATGRETNPMDMSLLSMLMALEFCKISEMELNVLTT